MIVEYNIRGMKSTDSKLTSRITKGLLIAIYSLLDDVSFNVAFSRVMKDRDNIEDSDERLSNEIVDRIFDLKPKIQSLLAETTSDNPKLISTLEKAMTFDAPLIEDIKIIIDLKLKLEEGYNLDDIEDKELYFLQNLVSIMRLRCLLLDIVEGIQEYDFKSFIAMTPKEKPVNILDGILTLSKGEIIEELKRELMMDFGDDDVGVKDRKKLLALCLLINQKGEQ